MGTLRKGKDSEPKGDSLCFPTVPSLLYPPVAIVMSLHLTPPMYFPKTFSLFTSIKDFIVLIPPTNSSRKVYFPYVYFSKSPSLVETYKHFGAHTVKPI